MSESKLHNFGKDLDDFVKSYLEQRFEAFIKHISTYLIHRNVHIVSERNIKIQKVEIYTGLDKIKGFMVQICRDEAIVTGDAILSINGTMLYVENGESDYRLTAYDRITWIVW